VPEAENIADREIVITRTFEAPRELVFEAWTRPEHVAQRWGPTGFTNTIHEMEVKPRGVWRFIMHGPDGVDYKNRSVSIEVAKLERLAFNHGADEDDPEQFHVIVTFDDEAGGTKLTMRSLFATAEQCAKTKEFGAVEGGNQTLDRLAAYLATM